MTKLELQGCLRALADREFFERGRLKEGIEAYQAMNADPPPRLFISCGCALWREGRYFEAAEAFAGAPLELVRDHLKACREECLLRRQVDHAVTIARLEGICIKAELAECAAHWLKQGHIQDSLAAYQAAGVGIPQSDFRGTGLVFQIQGSLGIALDAFAAANAPPPLKDLRDWLEHRTLRGRCPWLELRVLKTLLASGPE